ncbi:YihY/virulence factor BrkB family protein [Sphingomonas sp. G124]|jgi:membrane protein|uniref:YihY/virulence factor BrkB family protein n=1 Tax=Sphingomonas cremea TaxID=2904799 RepID=A0A9X1QMQ6_9SPHN|nr:YihY/virulence factor BrkB family protein [Sphingomonas cremea]MCF2515354.1 YihY/virulence factor BrkB family protein [Sphingomonas cremea]
MKELHPYSPEERRKRLARLRARFGKAAIERAKREIKPLIVAKRVGIGLYDDGFIHAGNLAYLSLLAMFPFFILAAAVARLFGRTQDASLAVAAILGRLPADVRHVLDGPIEEVIQGRSGALLWLGAIVGLWTAASFIETIRDILRRAYGVKFSASFWQYRLASMAVILASVVLLFVTFGLTVVMASVHNFVIEKLPISEGIGRGLGFYRLVPGLTLFATFYVIFLALTPSRYRTIECRKWPGALIVTLWWLVTVEVLPDVIGLFGGYETTYGSLAGVMVALIFFFVIGLGVVAGAELNAALVEPGGKALRGEHYEGPYEAELPVEEPAPEEELAAAARRQIGGN